MIVLFVILQTAHLSSIERVWLGSTLEHVDGPSKVLLRPSI